MKIAVYAIALNEEKFVERWYNSIKDADYILLADTGSTDKTVEIAESLGIIVKHIRISPWRFDDARNAALALVPDDIDMCLVLDLDEVVTPGWRKAIEDAWKYKITRPKYKHVWSWRDDGTPGLEYAYDHIHARHGYRWKHPVHEVLTPYGIEETSGFLEDLQTHHYPDPQKSRAQYLPLLAMSVAEDPHDSRNSYYYGRELYFHAFIPEAIAEFNRFLNLPAAVWNAERAAAYRYLAQCEPEKAEQHLLKSLEESYRREGLVLLAQHFYTKEDWEPCLEYAEKALAITDKPLDYLCETFAWNELPYDLAAISCYNLGKMDLALAYGLKASELNPNDQRLISNVNFYKDANNGV